MGLSGIGFSLFNIPDDLLPDLIIALIRAFAPFLNTIGNPIVNLTIHDNHIFNCSQNPINEVNTRGLGGISLGSCANLSIKGNRIEANPKTPKPQNPDYMIIY